MDNHNEKKTKQIKRILAIITIVFVILIGYFIGRPLVHFVSDPKQRNMGSPWFYWNEHPAGTPCGNSRWSF